MVEAFEGIQACFLEGRAESAEGSKLPTRSWLTQRDFEAFASSVEMPPNPKAALRKLMARK